MAQVANIADHLGSGGLNLVNDVRGSGPVADTANIFSL